MIHKLLLLAVVSVFLDSCLGSNPSYCDKISSPDKKEAKLGQIFKDLSSLNLHADINNGTGTIHFQVAVCGNASSSDQLSGAVQIYDGKTTVLGRVNDTEAVLGDSWLMVMLGSGDATASGPNVTMSHMATILFLCNETLKGDLHFVQELKPKSNISRCIMEVETSVVCPPKPVEEGTSHSFIFFSIVFFIVLAYFVGGALYRRFALGAKGMEQIPHIAFWSQLGENCRMYCCRRRRASSSLWHGNDAGDDDSLLQP